MRIFLIGILMVFSFYIMYFILYPTPLQNEQNIQLNENVGVDDSITVKKYKVFTFRIYTSFCNSMAQGYNLRMLCRV